MKKAVLVLLVLAGILAAAAAGVSYMRRESAAAQDVIRVSGNMEVTEVAASFKIAGRVAQRLVDEGDTVQTNQVIARLDDADLTREVALRKAECAAAAAVLAELEAGYRPEEIAQAVAALDRGKADLARLEADFGRQKDLIEKRVISSREFDASRAAFEIAQAQVRELDERLALLKKGPRQEQIDGARARVDGARQSLALAETRLGYATLVAPQKGVVLAKHVEPGEYAVAGTPIVTIGDIENVWLRAFIHETDLGRVRLGQQVKARTDTYPDKVYEGRISFIASEAEFTPKNVQTDKERVKLVYRIKVNVPNPNQELKPGMPVTAEIVLGAGQ